MKKIVKQALSFILVVTMIITIVGSEEVSKIFTIKAHASTSFSSMLDRAEALVNYAWTPVSNISTWNGNSYNGKTYFPKGQTIYGIPYTLFTSEVVSRSQCSLNDYKSVASSNYSTTDYCVSTGSNRTGPVYGSCCATFVAEVFGGSFVKSNGHPKTYNVGGIENIGNTKTGVKANDIKIGDALINTSETHVIWVGNITDSSITIYECTPPISRKKTVSKSSSINSSGYFVYEGSVYSIVSKSPDISLDINYTISYNANGGSGSMSSKTVKSGDSFTIASNGFTKSGYTFKGWNVKRSADSKWYVKGQGWFTESEISANGYER